MVKPAFTLYDLCNKSLSQADTEAILKTCKRGALILISVSVQDPNREQYICTETGLLFEMVPPPAYLAHLLN